MRQIDTVKKSKNFERIAHEAGELVKKFSVPGPAIGALEATPQETVELPNSFFRGPNATTEAIILDRLRPPYFIKDDKIEIHGDFDHVDLIQQHKTLLEQRARNVGRIDLLNHATYDFVGTGWLIEQDIVVTNRHVASIFAEADWTGTFKFKPGTNGDLVEAMTDYVRQHQTDLPRRRAFATEVIYISANNEPDIAFIKVDNLDDTTPLSLQMKRVEIDQPVAAVGYPAWDGRRNDPDLMDRLFGGVYNVKRFAPGLITGLDSSAVIIGGDYSSMGGNSGSAVLDLGTGDVVGLHFAGVFREQNYAVAADVVGAALSRTRTTVTVAPTAGDTEAPTSNKDVFAGRSGYENDFLGAGDLSVPMPDLGPWENDIAPVSDDQNDVLKYQNFSIVQSASRRLPLFTAVNIDGDLQKKLKRKGNWRLDGRIAAEHQVGNELYHHNPLDRGHMVRRRDPGWGSLTQAKLGEVDTFHYTNCAPQHAGLNQRDWVHLEDYLLSAIETRDFKASVFTGPVFRSDDGFLKNQPGAEDIRIPREFWKVAVMINADTGSLHATGYVLSHGPLIRNLTEAAFVFGQYETYQVPISVIEETTGLSFSNLSAFDPLGSTEETEEVTIREFVRISGEDSLKM